MKNMRYEPTIHSYDFLGKTNLNSEETHFAHRKPKGNEQKTMTSFEKKKDNKNTASIRCYIQNLYNKRKIDFSKKSANKMNINLKIINLLS